MISKYQSFDESRSLRNHNHSGLRDSDSVIDDLIKEVNRLSQTVEYLEKYINTQKNISIAISNGLINPLKK